MDMYYRETVKVEVCHCRECAERRSDEMADSLKRVLYAGLLGTLKIKRMIVCFTQLIA